MSDSWLSTDGKTVKTLDNHLARSHKETTRATNDRKPYPSPQAQRVWVKCCFPSCGKEVIHLYNHVKNVHSLKTQDYYSRFQTELHASTVSNPEKREVDVGNKRGTTYDRHKDNRYAGEDIVLGNGREKDMSAKKTKVDSKDKNAKEFDVMDESS